MKTLTIPKHLSHVLMGGIIQCVLCERICAKGARCPCCQEDE